MQKLALFVLTLAPFFAQADYARPQGYDANIPNAQARAKDSSWKAFPKFDTIHIVEENTGKPLKADVLTDAGIKADVQEGRYKSLQVRDLYTKDVKIEGSSVKIPFIVSVKHSFTKYDTPVASTVLSTINQGTIDVAGDLNVTITPDKVVKVTVTAFHDSQALESYGRYVGANYGTDLEWAKRIVVPTLEAYFQDPAHLGELIKTEVPTKL